MNPICNFCNNTSQHCCTESDKNYEAEQAKRERELREEDELFEVELSRHGSDQCPDCGALYDM